MTWTQFAGIMVVSLPVWVLGFAMLAAACPARVTTGQDMRQNVAAAMVLEILFLLGVMLMLSGCAVTDWIDGKTPFVDFTGSNDVAEVVTPPEVVAPVGEEQVSAISGDRASLALDPQGQPRVVFDKGTGNTIWYSERRPDGGWITQVWAQGSKGGEYDCSRIFLPHIEIDSLGRPWITAKLGVKEWGSMGGIGLWLPSGKFVLLHPKGSGAAAVRGNGMVLVGPSDVGTVVCSDGVFFQYAGDGTKLAAGQWKVGSSGEKIRACIEGDVFHLALNGCSSQEATYINSTMKKPVVWASYKAYPEMGNDKCHLTICANGKVVYIATQYSKGIYMNVWDGTRMLYSPTNLLLVAAGGYTGVDRFGPQMCPAQGGGVWIAYCKGKRIKLRRVWVSPIEVVCHDLENGWLRAVKMDDVKDICAGSKPTIAAAKDGIWVVYDNQGMKARKVAQ